MKSLKNPVPRLTLCLAIDLMGSTTAGLKLSTKNLDRFNLALVDQLGPYLQVVEMEHSLVKFTGDGWLVVSDVQEDAAKLCCLALIMANRFQWDIMMATGMPREAIPALRLSICWGRDLAVSLPNGARDFVGNSIRHAVRACQLCEDNEVLIDETVRAWISHDFATSPCETLTRLSMRPSVKMEEQLVLHALQEMNRESAQDPEAPIYFVNTFSLLGHSADADHLANLISNRLAFEATVEGLSHEELRVHWNSLLSSDLDHETARRVLQDLKKSGLVADIESYNSLIEYSDSFESERGWLDALTGDGLRPNTGTLNTCLKKARSPSEVQSFVEILLLRGSEPDEETLCLLIQKSGDYAAAKGWTDGMSKLGVFPNREAHELLLEKSGDFETAREWLERMMDQGWEPSENAFIGVFAKGILHISGEDLLSWYLGLKYHPAHPIKRAIADYRKAGQIEDALRLALDYPHTDTALKTVRQHPDLALRYFHGVVDENPRHVNGAYALGIALLEVGKPTEANPWLVKAYELAAPGARKDELERYITLFDNALKN